MPTKKGKQAKKTNADQNSQTNIKCDNIKFFL